MTPKYGKIWKIVWMQLYEKTEVVYSIGPKPDCYSLMECVMYFINTLYGISLTSSVHLSHLVRISSLLLATCAGVSHLRIHSSSSLLLFLIASANSFSRILHLQIRFSINSTIQMGEISIRNPLNVKFTYLVPI